MYEPPTKPDHCTAKCTCWERETRVMQPAINLATSLVKLRTQQLIAPKQFSFGWPLDANDSLCGLEQAVFLLRQLTNRRWREMTRPVDIYDPNRKEPEANRPSGLAALLAAKQPAATAKPIPRRGF